MKVIFNVIVMALIFAVGFAGMMATLVGVCSSVLHFQQAEIESVIYVLVFCAVMVSGFVTWGFYKQELK